jgi:hypothetical protein
MDREALLQSVREHLQDARQRREHVAKKVVAFGEDWQKDKDRFLRSLHAIERSKERLGQFSAPAPPAVSAGVGASKPVRLDWPRKHHDETPVTI